MSDEVSALASMRCTLERCTGLRGCPCGGASSTRSSPVASPSRSHSSTSGDANSGDSSHHAASDQQSKSKGTSDTLIPDGVPMQEWFGLGTVRVEKCEHGRHAILKKCKGGNNCGRRFLGCPVEDDSDQCQYLEWLDEPWPERVQAALKTVWKELNVIKRCEATANESLIEAIKLNKLIIKQEKELKEEVARTKRVAEHVYSNYQKKAAFAIVDKSKLMYLIYCLLGMIFLLVAIILIKVK